MVVYCKLHKCLVLDEVECAMCSNCGPGIPCPFYRYPTDEDYKIMNEYHDNKKITQDTLSN